MQRGILDNNGDVIPCSEREAAAWVRSKEGRARFIRETEVGRFVVSTVFLFCNHGSAEDPLWFESGVFYRDTWDELALARCATRSQALLQHSTFEWLAATADRALTTGEANLTLHVDHC